METIICGGLGLSVYGDQGWVCGSSSVAFAREERACFSVRAPNPELCCWVKHFIVIFLKHGVVDFFFI